MTKEHCTQLAQYHIPRWDELPDIDLYMDQVISQLDKYLAPLSNDENEHFITASMINNYVKQHVLPAPVRKKYGRVHLAFLVATCLLKQVMSIPEIQMLLDAHFSGDGLSGAYDDFCDAQEKAFSDTAVFIEKSSAACPTLAVHLALQASAAKTMAQSLMKL